jgi:hypothetical protein
MAIRSLKRHSSQRFHARYGLVIVGQRFIVVPGRGANLVKRVQLSQL